MYMTVIVCYRNLLTQIAFRNYNQERFLHLYIFLAALSCKMCTFRRKQKALSCKIYVPFEWCPLNGLPQGYS